MRTVHLLCVSSVLFMTAEGQWHSTGKRIYGVYNIPRDWYQAKEFCGLRAGAQLFRPEVDSERVFIQSILDSMGVISEFWIGAEDFGLDGVFTWEDKTPITSADWFPGIPWLFGIVHNTQPTGEQQCVEWRRQYQDKLGVMQLQSRYTWNDAYCTDQHGFVCELFACGFGPTSGMDCDLNIKAVHVCDRRGKRDAAHIVMATVTCRSNLQCVGHCLASPTCMATNYDHESHTCELLSQVEEDASVLVNDAGYHYFKSSTYC